MLFDCTIIPWAMTLRQSTRSARRRLRRLSVGLLALGMLCAVVPRAHAQDAVGPASGVSDADQFRLTFFTYDQMAYIEHPFYQITGDGDYKGAHGGIGGTFRVETPETDTQAGGLEKILHSLPAFAVEWVWQADLAFPSGLSVGLDYSRISLADKQALSGKSGVEVPRITMDTYYYAVPIRLFVFDPTEPGINYFVGVSLGLLNGKIAARPYSGATTEIITFNQSPYGSTRLGLEATGDNYGFRYEMRLVNADEV